MNSIYNYTLDELKNRMVELGEKPYRALQIFEWLYRSRVSSFEEMTNISKKSIDKLKENFTIDILEIDKLQISKDGENICLN